MSIDGRLYQFAQSACVETIRTICRMVTLGEDFRKSAGSGALRCSDLYDLSYIPTQLRGECPGPHYVPF
ncbi:hypothetical protein ABIF64_000400 [Bradyrhizobium japonicum]|nr:hypothetical protein [Bradyrhizobium japonicum]MCP1793269.1 hypothetical protein [Bradyrhizobium japonicum]MCP1805702.1 hypothetical protein [Bradyrhizobium japonicum]MCP1814719.1 hypothetical protein [Bradyrhizobium japonicum]MCP1873852.1 hypothetical protein [Bradyrhizobium japonicum]